MMHTHSHTHNIADDIMGFVAAVAFQVPAWVQGVEFAMKMLSLTLSIVVGLLTLRKIIRERKQNKQNGN